MVWARVLQAFDVQPPHVGDRAFQVRVAAQLQRQRVAGRHMRARPARAHAERDARVTCRRQVNVAIEPAAYITATLDVAALRPWPAPSI